MIPNVKYLTGTGGLPDKRSSDGDEDHKLIVAVLNHADTCNHTWRLFALERVLALGLDSMGISSLSSLAFNLYASLPGVNRNTPEKTICTNTRCQSHEAQL